MITSVIFLDFDGVLNSQRWFIANEQTIKENAGFTWRHASELDPDAVRRVLRIIETTGAAIVISSSWRIIHTRDEINLIFEMAGFPEMTQHIIDRTGFDLTHHVLRGKEIQDWIKDYEAKNGKLESYVILDDDGDMLSSQSKQFVQTPWEEGIQDHHVDLAIKILGVKHIAL